mgnify:CR=1 FL=1
MAERSSLSSNSLGITENYKLWIFSFNKIFQYIFLFAGNCQNSNFITLSAKKLLLWELLSPVLGTPI